MFAGKTVSERQTKQYPEAMKAFADYLMCTELGILPFEGAWKDQPNTVRVFFEIFRAASAEATKEAQSK